MTARLLPRAEWTVEKIGHLPLWAELPKCNPSQVRIVVTEDGDRVVAACLLLRVWMAHGLYVEPPYRRGNRALWRLWRGVQDAARRLGVGALATETNPTIAPFLKFVKAVPAGMAVKIPIAR